MNKMKYPDADFAWNKALFYFTKYGEYQTAYRCVYCKFYHLTSTRAQPNPPEKYIRKLAKWFHIPYDKFNKIIS